MSSFPGSRAPALLLAACLAFAASACTDAEDPVQEPGGWVILDPQDPARDYDVDLGLMDYGETREHVVRFQNAEGRPLSIRRVTAACSCTVPYLAYVDASGTRVQGPLYWGEGPFVVPADATLEMTLRVDSKLVPARNAVKRVRIVIDSDSQVDPFQVIEAHVVVQMPFYVVPAVIDLGQVAVDGVAFGSTSITQAMGTGELITGILSQPDNMEVALETPEQTLRGEWRLTIRWLPPLERGVQRRSVVLSTTGPGGTGTGRPLEVPIQAIGVANVIAEPMAFSVPPTIEQNGGAGAVTLRSLVGGNRLLVTGTRTEGPAAESFHAQAMAIEPDASGRSERWTVQLTCVREVQAQGAFAGTVVVSLDDPVTPEVRIPYTRKAQP